jgi:hypothetical protein
MTDETLIRAVAALAAVALLAAPALSGVVENLKAWWASRPAPEPVAPDTSKADAARLADMRLVLDLAARLKADGVADGVALCQQLLDVMLTGKAKK